MSCTLSLGRLVPCKDSVGGLKNVYFADFGKLGTVTIDDDSTGDNEVSNMTGTTVSAVDNSLILYKYELKGNSSFEQTITASRENGTTFFEQNLTLTLTKLTKADHKELKLIAFGRPHVFVEDYNGNVFLAGLKHGMDVNGGTIVTGAAMGDLSGYTLTLQGMETLPANFCTVDATNAAFPISEFAGLTGTKTITEGS